MLPYKHYFYSNLKTQTHTQLSYIKSNNKKKPDSFLHVRNQTENWNVQKIYKFSFKIQTQRSTFHFIHCLNIFIQKCKHTHTNRYNFCIYLTSSLLLPFICLVSIGTWTKDNVFVIFFVYFCDKVYLFTF